MAEKKKKTKKQDAERAPEALDELSSHIYYFHQGTDYRAYEFLGVHREPGGYVFRTWAPRADEIYVVGDWNGWERIDPMKKISDGGVWEAHVKCDGEIAEENYKYLVVGGGREAYKSDPYAVYDETLVHTASKVYPLPSFKWNDGAWMSERMHNVWHDGRFYSSPMNVYEMHLGSWRTKNGETTYGNENAYLNYREIADQLVPYICEMGYTHVELLPVAEHPYDGSWGYQICGYFAPSSRFGRPEDFMYFVDKLHASGIGVIMDWVPAHFPKDEHGLYEFDGHPTYEYQGKDRMEHKAWGTRCFDLGRNEVQCFLISNALYWLRHYHIDGLRVDAVASMLYLDYDRRPGEWTPNVYGENKSLEAIAFLRKLNDTIHAEFSDVMMIAEESTAWYGVTKSPAVGGLGFNFKWNMGWANDMFDYIQCDPAFRGGCHGKLTFPMMYAYSENYILPVSHDEVVHGKKSLIDKMFGPYEDKFAEMRAFLVYMMTLPGKKLMFMGQEYGQFREWDYQNQLEWFMLDYEKHRKLCDFTAAINHLYLATPALWEIDDGWDGFEWIKVDDDAHNVLAYKRRDTHGGEVFVLINFSGAEWKDYELPLPYSGTYRVLLNTEWQRFGGGLRAETLSASRSRQTREVRAKLDIPPFSGIIFEKK